MLARMALVRSPSFMMTVSPVSRSVATARNGVGSSSKFVTLATGSVSRRNVWLSFCPCISPLGN